MGTFQKVLTCMPKWSKQRTLVTTSGMKQLHGGGEGAGGGTRAVKNSHGASGLPAVDFCSSPGSQRPFPGSALDGGLPILIPTQAPVVLRVLRT